MKFYSELIIYCLLVINTSRVFFNRTVKHDSLVILAPLAFVLSLLSCYANGLSFYGILLVVLSFGIVILNFPAFLRNTGKLFLDTFSIKMKVSCGISLFLILLSFVFCFINREVVLDNKKLNISERTICYEGSFKTGFREPEIFSKRTAYFHEYKSNLVLDGLQNVVVFVSDKRGDSAAYKPYLQLLAANGYTVCTFDFYNDDISWGYSSHFLEATRAYYLSNESLHNEKKFSENSERYKYNVYLECKAMLPLLQDIYGQKCKYFFVSDGLSSESVKKFLAENQNLSSGNFYLESISEYTTSGYGCVEMTNPFIANKLNVKRDKHGFITRYLVLKTSAAIRDAWS